MTSASRMKRSEFHHLSNRSFLTLFLLSMPLFIIYDVLLLTYTTQIPSALSFMSFEIALVCFGISLFVALRRFGRSKQWGHLGVSLLAWCFTAFFFIGILALE